MELEEKDYREFVRDRRRQKYLKEEAELHGEFSYHSYDTDDYSGEELIVDVLCNVEEEVIRRDMIEMVRMLISELPESDRNMIIALFFDRMTEVDYARISGIPRTTIRSKKAAILNGWKKYF